MNTTPPLTQEEREALCVQRWRGLRERSRERSAKDDLGKRVSWKFPEGDEGAGEMGGEAVVWVGPGPTCCFGSRQNSNERVGACHATTPPAATASPP